MTREEHQTRIMLLGYAVYNECGGYYSKYGKIIDAITLEPLSVREAVSRLHVKKEVWYPHD